MDVGFFIGVNCMKVIKLREVIFGVDDDFYVVWIIFGWGVIGIMNCIIVNS